MTENIISNYMSQENINYFVCLIITDYGVYLYTCIKYYLYTSGVLVHWLDCVWDTTYKNGSLRRILCVQGRRDLRFPTLLHLSESRKSQKGGKYGWGTSLL